MALAKKCDRCGRLYEHYPTSDKPGIRNGVQLIRRSATNNQVSYDKEKDLCNYCMNDLQNFLRNPNMTVVEVKPE